jgi:hypothetical protein
MTILAGDGGVLPFQHKGGLEVIKLNFVPGCYLVTIFATLGWIVFRIDSILVNILVAIHTSLTNVPEAPLLFLPVTFKTRCSEMGAFQFKFALIVLLNGK